VIVSFIGGGNRSTRRKPQTCHKSLPTLSHNVVSSTLRLSGNRTLVMLSTDCIDSCKSNYHTMTVTTTPLVLFKSSWIIDRPCKNWSFCFEQWL